MGMKISTLSYVPLER